MFTFRRIKAYKDKVTVSNLKFLTVDVTLKEAGLVEE
jgi:hypothetical protein